MTAFADPRVRMRDALRQLVEQDPTAWDGPSLLILRNRLLDFTGSDARPLAELLIEALRRGFRERLPEGALESARWDALVAPFVMQWSAERFVQPDMARWAVECWGYALRTIQPEQLRIAPPPKREPIAALAARLNATAASSGVQAARSAGLQLAGAPRANPRGPTRAAPARVVASGPARSATPYKPYTPYSPRARVAAPAMNPWIARGMVGVLGLMGLGVIVQAAIATRNAPAVPTERVATVSVAPPTADARAGAANALVPTISNRVVPPSLTGGVTINAPANPGVPSITRAMLPTGADSGRMLFVDPARRAVGDSRQANIPMVASQATYDEVHLEDGTTMRGRVEIVRAGAVIFRDLRTGLRHELRKEEINEIITEFGTPVRFRANAVRSAGGPPRTRAMVTAATNAGLRARGVGGSYRIRYAAPVAVGSSECASVWSRAPDAVDRAIVRHLPGADTLTLAFDAGDNFPSNVDADGFFASTFRIVPDQARTSTALTTRLTGQFRANGSLALTVNIVFFRRVRSGADLACTVTVKAEGQRES
ncbi:hypothetical protein [Gemmatimonas groenlandica]|uniref:Uncharacterized protein n=1 Tax=Gemmatimonas groenlandica TaxID=2732249 RepID=A0A6M4IQ27_9BACT|nr:hypothetical protein [Gemmatimonas groenlandica]QJR35607.1 hypothetical protein HKW67_08840 [Gemmatimonas groenlandica]